MPAGRAASPGCGTTFGPGSIDDQGSPGPGSSSTTTCRWSTPLRPAAAGAVSAGRLSRAAVPGRRPGRRRRARPGQQGAAVRASGLLPSATLTWFEDTMHDIPCGSGRPSGRGARPARRRRQGGARPWVTCPPSASWASGGHFQKRRRGVRPRQQPRRGRDRGAAQHREGAAVGGAGDVDIGIFALENSNGGVVYRASSDGRPPVPGDGPVRDRRQPHPAGPSQPPGSCIERIAAHQQAIRQCRMWLRHQFLTTLVTEEPYPPRPPACWPPASCTVLDGRDRRRALRRAVRPAGAGAAHPGPQVQLSPRSWRPALEGMSDPRPGSARGVSGNPRGALDGSGGAAAGCVAGRAGRRGGDRPGRRRRRSSWPAPRPAPPRGPQFLPTALRISGGVVLVWLGSWSPSATISTGVHPAALAAGVGIGRSAVQRHPPARPPPAPPAASPGRAAQPAPHRRWWPMTAQDSSVQRAKQARVSVTK